MFIQRYSIVASLVLRTKNEQTFEVELSLLYEQKTTQLYHYNLTL